MATAIALGVTGDRLQEALLDRGIDEGLAAGIPVALEHYGTTPNYLAAVRDLATDAAGHVAGDLEEVPELSVDPDSDGDVTAADLLPEPVEAIATTAENEPEAPDGASSAAPKPEIDVDAAGVDAEDTLERPTETGESSDEPQLDESEPIDTPDSSEAETQSDPAEFDLDADEREAVETEYGTEFQSAAEVDEPGEADIETPTPESALEDDDPAESPSEPDDSESEADDPEESQITDGETEPIDLVDTVVAAMAEQDDGDGADRAAVIEAVTDQTGADAAEVEEAIQDALMDGRCYEPDDGTLMPI